MYLLNFFLGFVSLCGWIWISKMYLIFDDTYDFSSKTLADFKYAKVIKDGYGIPYIICTTKIWHILIYITYLFFHTLTWKAGLISVLPFVSTFCIYYISQKGWVSVMLHYRPIKCKNY